MVLHNAPIQAVIFDLDGTLLCTEHLQWKGWNVALRTLGVPLHLTKKQYQNYCGRSGHEIEKELLAEYGFSLPVGALLRAKERFLHSHFNSEPLHWTKGARFTLRYFRSLSIPVGLATGGKRDEMMKKLRKLDAHLHFDTLVCLSDVKNGKPHPDIYREACHRLGVQPSHALAFEDTSSGVLSASRAGLRVIAIPTPYSSKQDFSSAWAVCRDFKQAMKRIGNIEKNKPVKRH